MHLAFKGASLRDSFIYRDLGIAAATHGKVVVQFVRANLAQTFGTGWHLHEADFHSVIMLDGWARFEAGDCVNQATSIAHYC